MPRSAALAAVSVVLGMLVPSGAAAGVRAPRAPHLLPGDAAAAAVRADRATWLVGVRPGARGAAIARRYGARRVGPGMYVVARGRARGLVAAARASGTYTYSEPDRLSRRLGLTDPLMPAGNWRDVVVAGAPDPPAVRPESPLLALIDSQAELHHPEFQGGNLTGTSDVPASDEHGTATAAVAGAPVNGIGIVGTWPGMRMLNVSAELNCSSSAEGITEAVRRGASVVNMSYGGPNLCFTEFMAIEYAVGRGVLPVAAAGNEFADGNPLSYPAALPHVLTVAAMTPDLRSAFFSNENAAIDLAAPGVAIVTAVPPAHDPDGVPDGWSVLDGTSFSSPIVAALAAWVRDQRPDLDGYQTGQVLKAGAQDLMAPGWDTSTGWGLARVGPALTAAAPPRDLNEPNDDIGWVNGRYYPQPARPIFSGGARPATVDGLLDKFEDYADVFRIVMPAHSRMRVTVHSRSGDADLAAYDHRARTTATRKWLIHRSARTGSAVDSTEIVNPGARQSVYVAAYIDQGAQGLDAAYQLTARRLRGR